MVIKTKVSDNDLQVMFELYNKTFPLLKTNLHTFCKRLSLKNNSQVILELYNDNIIGFSVVNDNGILLLCVSEEHQRKGIGSALLKKSEQIIGEMHDKIKLGSSKSGYLIAGVPMDGKSTFHSFFEKRGYKNTWISYDMIINLREYERKYELDNKDNNIIFRKRFDSIEDKKAAQICGDIIGGWGSAYESNRYIHVAQVDGRIVGGVTVEPGFCLFSESFENTGSIGCLGVIPEYQKRGIGMHLCQDALCLLKSQGCELCYIGYTWLDWWYGKLGAQKYIHYWMGEKLLSAESL